jgi:hypothetical protein
MVLADFIVCYVKKNRRKDTAFDFPITLLA